MTQYRIVSNGYYFRVQKRSWPWPWWVFYRGGVAKFDDSKTDGSLKIVNYAMRSNAEDELAWLRGPRLKLKKRRWRPV